jgi:hypothetical protein
MAGALPERLAVLGVDLEAASGKSDIAELQ